MLTRLEFSRDADALFTHVETCWRDAAAGRDMPRRSDISPSKLGRALPYVALIDVLHGLPMDFRYRLIGQHLIVNTGQNLTGKRSLELPATTPAGRPVYDTYVKCVQTAKPRRFDLEVLNMNGTKRRMQGLILPLSDDGRTADALLGVALYRD